MVSAFWTSRALWVCGKSSMTNPDARSTSVPMAEPLAVPVMRSPSQCPGTARSSTSTGRSRIETIPASRLRRYRVCGVAYAGCDRSASIVPVRVRVRFGLEYRALIDRLVGHAHLGIVGELDRQSPADLFGTPFDLQMLLNIVAQSGITLQQWDFRSNARLSARAWATVARYPVLGRRVPRASSRLIVEGARPSARAGASLRLILAAKPTESAARARPPTDPARVARSRSASTRSPTIMRSRHRS